ncbi:hypothetical protein HXX76_001731 [Chlamydomonas incerta]|uniref:Uncharacterized protein n=1 Tax=Chlamydomonas incerta TaxID=51695 RepID=A0A835TQD0_CHLIN|nr:hypothetical protein HXX76_001731 [Chlamydomonas incerta]|eukprot:KAG2443370.1 hypothetical protein HXX76_001731 [Chlamydomonas incerta]
MSSSPLAAALLSVALLLLLACDASPDAALPIRRRLMQQSAKGVANKQHQQQVSATLALLQQSPFYANTPKNQVACSLDALKAQLPLNTVVRNNATRPFAMQCLDPNRPTPVCLPITCSNGGINCRSTTGPPPSPPSPPAACCQAIMDDWFNKFWAFNTVYFGECQPGGPCSDAPSEPICFGSGDWPVLYCPMPYGNDYPVSAYSYFFYPPAPCSSACDLNTNQQYYSAAYNCAYYVQNYGYYGYCF